MLEPLHSKSETTVFRTHDQKLMLLFEKSSVTMTSECDIDSVNKHEKKLDGGSGALFKTQPGQQTLTWMT